MLKNFNSTFWYFSAPINIIQKSCFTIDSTFDTTIPSVPRRSREIYDTYVDTATRGPLPPSHHDLLLYQSYANQTYTNFLCAKPNS